MTAPATAPQQPPVDQGLTAGQLAVYALEAAMAARLAQLAVRAALMRDVVRLWPLLQKDQLQQSYPGWLQAMQLLILNYHGQSSQAAAAFYRAARAQALQSPTPASLVRLAPSPDPVWMAKALSFAGPGMLSKDTAQPGSALSTTLGTAARIALDGGRTTLTDTAHADPAAVGYFRLTDGDPCAFCAMLASRGVVYKQHSFDASNRKFVGGGADKVHNLCGCTLAPAFSRKQPLPLVNSVARDVYMQSTYSVDGKQKLAAFRKAWADKQGQGLPPKPQAPPPKAARGPQQVQAELAALENALPGMTGSQSAWAQKRIAALRTQFGQ